MKSLLRHGGGTLVCLVAITALSGCLQLNPAEFGTVVDAKPGQFVPDFSFEGTDGKVATFSQARSVVTVVAFSPSKEWPHCKKSQEIADVAGRLASSMTPVTVFAVGDPATPCKKNERNLRQCHITSRANFVSLLDWEGRVAKMYGPHAVGKFFVIDHTGRVSSTGNITDMVTLERGIRAAVSKHDDWWRQLHPQTATRRL